MGHLVCQQSTSFFGFRFICSVSKVYDNRTKDELEHEAELAEQTEIYDSDPLVTIRTKRNTYHIRKSKQKKLREIADRELEEWIQMQKYILTEQKYLELLCNYDKYLKEREWQQMM